MIVKERGIYIGTIQAEPWGVSFDYEKDNLYRMNRFLSYLIQNQDAISERIKEQFSSAKAELFLSIINKHDEYEVFYFHNLERIDIGDTNCNNLDFQIGNNCIVLKQIDIELIFLLPINDSVDHNIIFNDQEVDFEKIEEYAGKKVNLLSDPDFPHIFMTESQVKSNNDYLTKIIDELLFEIGLNSNVNKTELAKIFGEKFLK
jgi:hypothetical protein